MVESDDNPACGFPVCVLIDQRPKRFSSMCKFLGYLTLNNLDRRFFHVQKGDCADASKYRAELGCNNLYRARQKGRPQVARMLQAKPVRNGMHQQEQNSRNLEPTL